MGRPSPLAMFRLRYLDACDDPSAAPAAYRGPYPARAWTLRRCLQNMVWVYAFGLVFLIFGFTSLTVDDPAPALLVLRIILLVAIAVGYLLAAWMADASLPVRWAYIVLFASLVGMTAVVWGVGFVGYSVYVSILLATLLPWRQSRIAIPAWSLLIAATTLLADDPLPLYLALVGLVAGLATGGGIEAGRIAGRLQAAEQRVSRLSVAAERERIARDLHDILGHSLTAISIKSELSAKLVDTDPAAARREMAEVEAVARQALADVRATASAMREVRVASELASARSVLLAAGIEARVPVAVPPMPDAQSELFGYVVREAVTNVVRHSEATLCTITVAADEVSVVDNGTGRVRSAADGTGLTGLAARAASAGAVLEVESAPGAGMRVRVGGAPTAARATSQPVQVAGS